MYNYLYFLGLKNCYKDIKNNVEELVIATNSTLEGQTTAYFITEFFKDHNIKTSRLANGIPFWGRIRLLR